MVKILQRYWPLYTRLRDLSSGLTHMDDKEYYSLMNRSSSWAIQQTLKKNKSSKTNKVNSSEKTGLPDNAQTYASLELRQGSADTECLWKKNNSVIYLHWRCLYEIIFR